MIACADCRFHDDSYGNNCSHPAVMKPDPIYGEVLETCHSARSADGKCGLDARFFAASRMSRIRNWACALPSTARGYVE